MRGRGAAAVALALAAVGAGVVSVESVRDQMAVLRACEAAQNGSWELALSGTEGRVGSSEAGRAAAECRCQALLASGREHECTALLDDLLDDPDTDGWAPQPALSVHLIQIRRDADRPRAAAALARRAATVHPEDPDLFYLELVTRSAVEDEESVLRELAERIPAAGDAATRMRVSLAQRHLLRSDPRAALAALGTTPPPRTAASLATWYDARGTAFAQAGEVLGARHTYAEWGRAGGDPREVRARYALAMSQANLLDPHRAPVDLLREALGDSSGLDAGLRESLTIRLVLTLAAAGELEAALVAYDRGRREFELAGLTREELIRAEVQRELATESRPRRRGTLRFELPEAGPGWQLLVSPDPDAPVDAAYQVIPVGVPGPVDVERSVSGAPQRWVVRDPHGAVRGSGTAQTSAGGSLEIRVTLRAPRMPEPADLGRRPADGRRRILLVLLDCADWRIAQYLRARGDLPVFDALVRSGFSAVLTSDPPLTAAALEALVWPTRRSGTSLVGQVHWIGLELAGLASIGDNPFAGLSWLLPAEQDVFATLGAGELAALNLLFAHGGIRAGRHAEISGPHGGRRRIPIGRSARSLNPEERSRWPALGRPREKRDGHHVETIAAELDVARELARSGEPDLVMLRIEPLDLLTHAYFADAVQSGQDDGDRFLFSVYRYIDARLGEVHAALDADDVLIVMSDHGIRTAMEHSSQAIFVASGFGVPSARAAGAPDLRGVPRLLAELLDVDTDWPDTGIASWAGVVADAEERGSVRDETRDGDDA